MASEHMYLWAILNLSLWNVKINFHTSLNQRRKKISHWSASSNFSHNACPKCTLTMMARLTLRSCHFTPPCHFSVTLTFVGNGIHTSQNSPWIWNEWGLTLFRWDPLFHWDPQVAIYWLLCQEVGHELFRSSPPVAITQKQVTRHTNSSRQRKT